MQGNLRRIRRVGGQIGMSTPQGQGRSHFFDSFEKPVARCQRRFAEPSRNLLARIAGDVLDICFT